MIDERSRVLGPSPRADRADRRAVQRGGRAARGAQRRQPDRRAGRGAVPPRALPRCRRLAAGTAPSRWTSTCGCGCCSAASSSACLRPPPLSASASESLSAGNEATIYAHQRAYLEELGATPHLQVRHRDLAVGRMRARGGGGAGRAGARGGGRGGGARRGSPRGGGAIGARGPPLAVAPPAGPTPAPGARTGAQRGGGGRGGRRPTAGGGAGAPGVNVAMHMSDGLVNAPTAAAFGLSPCDRAGHRGQPGPRRPGRPHGADGRARHRVRLRRPDDQLSDPARGQRPPARRRAGRDPGRARGSARCASRSCWSCRPCCSPTAGSPRSAPTSPTWRSSACSPATRGGARAAPGRPAQPRAAARHGVRRRASSTVVASLGFVLEYAIGGAGGPRSAPCSADGRPARADRHRRGRSSPRPPSARSRHPPRPGLPAARAGPDRARSHERASASVSRAPVLDRLPAGRPGHRRRAVLLRQPAPGRAGLRHAQRLHGPDGEGEQLDGSCIAQHAERPRRSPAARSPTTPSAAATAPGRPAGVIGVLVTGARGGLGCSGSAPPTGPGATRADGRGEWARATPTRCTCRALAGAPAAGRGEDRRRVPRRSCAWWRRRGRRSPCSRGVPRCCSPPCGRSPGSRSAGSAPRADRAAVRRARGAAAVHRAGPPTVECSG